MDPGGVNTDNLEYLEEFVGILFHCGNSLPFGNPGALQGCSSGEEGMGILIPIFQPGKPRQENKDIPKIPLFLEKNTSG